MKVLIIFYLSNVTTISTLTKKNILCKMEENTGTMLVQVHLKLNSISYAIITK